MKKTIKTTKALKPKYIADLTKVQTHEDIYLSVVRAKVNRGIKITPYEFNAVISNAIDQAVMLTFQTLMCSAFIGGLERAIYSTIAKINKPNIFKRFWNWVTRKNA